MGRQGPWLVLEKMGSLGYPSNSRGLGGVGRGSGRVMQSDRRSPVQEELERQEEQCLPACHLQTGQDRKHYKLWKPIPGISELKLRFKNCQY